MLAIRPVIDSVILSGYMSSVAELDAITVQLRKLVEGDTTHVLSFTRVGFSPLSLSCRQKDVEV